MAGSTNNQDSNSSHKKKNNDSNGSPLPTGPVPNGQQYRTLRRHTDHGAALTMNTNMNMKGHGSTMRRSNEEYSLHPSTATSKSTTTTTTTSAAVSMTTSIAAPSSLRSSTSRSFVPSPSPYLKSWQLLNMDVAQDTISGNNNSNNNNNNNNNGNTNNCNGNAYDDNDKTNDYRSRNQNQNQNRYHQSLSRTDRGSNHAHEPASATVASPLARSATYSVSSISQPGAATPTATPTLISTSTGWAAKASTPSSSTATTLSATHSSSSIYGTKNTKRSLEDDDPSDSAANIVDHLTLTPLSVSASISASQPFSAMGSQGMGMVWSSSISPPPANNNNNNNNNSSNPNFFLGRDESAPMPDNTPPRESWQSTSISGGGQGKRQGQGHEQHHRHDQQQQQCQELQPRLSPYVNSSNSCAPAGNRLGGDRNHGRGNRNQQRSAIGNTNNNAINNTNSSNEQPRRAARPKNDEDYNYNDNDNDNDEQDENDDHKTYGQSFPTAASIAAAAAAAAASASTSKNNADDFIPLAKEHLRSLMSALTPLTMPTTTRTRTRTMVPESSSSSSSSRTETLSYEINTRHNHTIQQVRKFVEACKNDQETLEGKLRTVLEENADATGHIQELFELNEEILTALEAGRYAVQRERERERTKTYAHFAHNISTDTNGGTGIGIGVGSSPAGGAIGGSGGGSGSAGAGKRAVRVHSVVEEGPTIGLLEENRDVFSLICMLRAPNEKRMQAALALTKFAKEDSALRHEIISSGGIHSFLSLFEQTRGMTRELKVVASLAVAYILPSYVVSSQTTPSIGLKLVECLHFLATSNPVSPNGMVLSVEELCRAASVGVNVLWVNAIQPLIALEKLKNSNGSGRHHGHRQHQLPRESSSSSTAGSSPSLSLSPPSLRPGKTVRYGRLRSRTGGGVFDQGHESIEIQELTELAVTLIAHLAKLTESGKVRIDTGYSIVEQVCEVDEARPIAVREGLLAIFVEWIRSGIIEKVRPAASALRYLIAIQDKYMAGWIHSQVVNEGAVNEIVKLLNESVGQDVRLAVAEMLSYLCVAPHTRAAVVNANGVNYLVSLLFEHSAPDMEDIVMFACTALLQLAAGAMTGASPEHCYGDYNKYSDNATKHTNVVDDIINGCAHGSFVQIALEHEEKLRSISIEALRVLSEDTDSYRQTRLQLCSVGAAETLGVTIKDNASVIELLSHPDEFRYVDVDAKLITSVKDTYRALRALANILEPQRESKKSQNMRRMDPELKPNELLVKGCLDLASSGGLPGIIRVSALSMTPSFLAESKIITLDRIDLLEEACRFLANLSPLLLSETATSGVANWAIDVFEALDGILNRLNKGDGKIVAEVSTELNIDALLGIGALAVYEPLKIRIVNQTLPKLLLFKNMGGDRIDIATAANQVLLSMGFIEDEITVQVAGNNPQFLVDLFCLQRALLLQAMARAEIWTKVLELWQLSLGEVDPEHLEELKLKRQPQRVKPSGIRDDKSVDSQDEQKCKDLFENFTSDYDSRDIRAKFLRQYLDVYETSNRLKTVLSNIDQALTGNHEAKNMMASHVFPLNDTREEKNWVLSHYHALNNASESQKFSVSGNLPQRVEILLDSCFPSKLLRNYIVPVNDLLPLSSFNFRAFMMPKRRYYSFRREGELLALLCDKQGSVIDSDDVHWTLGFTNSTFAGEFVESLVQTLYKHPLITGLSFIRTPECIAMRDAENRNDADDGGGLLANLSGSLPPWVSYLTFDNMLNDRDLRALVAILDTIGTLSSGQDFDDEISQVSIGTPQGNFTCMSIRNSLQIKRESWSSFFLLMGKMGLARRNPAPAPLSMLKILDLTGNNLGDEGAAMVLELVHDKYSGCSIEQLDLTGNGIGRGTNVVRVLRSYAEYYRYNQKTGVKMMRNSWQSSLNTLILSSNDLFLGQAGLEIFALLKHDALCLRYLDLSHNGLRGDQLLLSSLLKNTSLCHLNLSDNKFDTSLLDLILNKLNNRDAESSLSFLLFDNNSPPLTAKQNDALANFLQRSRKNGIDRYIMEREKQEFDESADTLDANESKGGELDLLIDEETKTTYTGAQESTTSSNDPGENQITVLFSAPLVFADGANNLHPFAKLDFEMERELLWQCMKEASRDIDMSFDNAHHSRLLASLTRRCSVLHYSGHGHQSFLPFEDGMGGPNWLSVQDIKELILQDGVVPFKFVFVSACHSGLAGETFASAGVPHVVCCKQESELKDTAALAFTRSFYLALLMGHTVKESFDQGCKAVRVTPNLKDPDEEMKKFVLLPDGGDHNKPVFRAKSIREWPKQHRSQGFVTSRSSRRRGSRGNYATGGVALGTKSSELSVRNMMQEDPSPTPPQFFLGREVDLYYVLSALLKLNKRLVSVLGETGIGRSSLVCALCHYINERASTISEIQQIYFIKPKQGDRNVLCRSLVRQLLEKLEENGKCRPTDEDKDTSDTEAMLEIICRKLKNDKCLIIFDRTELIKSSDVECLELPKILSTILYETKQVRVVITAHSSLGQPAIGGQVEHSYSLGPLTYVNTVKLFANLCPHLHTPSERGMLVKKLVRNDEDQMNLLPDDSRLKARTTGIFSVIGDGIPAKIEKAAYGISREDLERLQKA